MKKLALAVGIALATTTGFAALNNGSPIIMSYYENWSVYSTTNPQPFPGNAKGMANPGLAAKLKEVNTLAYAFFEVDSNGYVYFSDAWSDLAQKDGGGVSGQPDGWCTKSSSVLNASGQAETVPNSSICVQTSGYNMGYGNFDAFAASTVANKFISIGGFGHVTSWDNAFNYPQNFADSIVAIIKQYPGINGVDLDAEPLQQITPSSLINLAKVLRETLNQNGLNNVVISLPVTVSQTQITQFGASNWQQLMQYVNYVSAMGYDMHGEFDAAGSPPTGQTALQSTLYTTAPSGFSDNNGIKALESMGVPASKIILGLPAYARGVGGVSGNGLNQTFTTSFDGDLDAAGCTTTLGQGNTCGGMASYNWLQTQVANNKLQEQPVTINGAVSGVYVNFNGDFFSYDNATSAAAKTDYAKSQGLAGMMVWAIGDDTAAGSTSSLLGAINKAYAN